VRVPVKSVYKYFPLPTTSNDRGGRSCPPRSACSCHRSDGTGAAPQLTLHGNNRTEERRCASCVTTKHTDIPFRRAADPEAVVGRYAYPEQSLDFKTLVHGFTRVRPASAKSTRPSSRSIIRSSTRARLVKFPGELRNCVTCHIDNRSKGTFELPLSPDVLGSTFDTGTSIAPAEPSRSIGPTNDVKIQPYGRRLFVVSRRGEENRSHGPGRRSVIRTTQAELDGRVVVERCVGCHVRARRCLFAGCTKSGNPSVLEAPRAAIRREHGRLARAPVHDHDRRCSLPDKDDTK